MTQKVPKINSLEEIIVEERKKVRVKIEDYISPTYNKIRDMQILNGKLVYIAKENTWNTIGKEFVVVDGKEHPKYNSIENPRNVPKHVNPVIEINGKICYIARTDRGYVSVIDGVEGEKTYRWCSDGQEFEGHFFMYAFNEDKNELVEVHDGREEPLRKDDVDALLRIKNPSHLIFPERCIKAHLETIKKKKK